MPFPYSSCHRVGHPRLFTGHFTGEHSELVHVGEHGRFLRLLMYVLFQQVFVGIGFKITSVHMGLHVPKYKNTLVTPCAHAQQGVK